MFDVPITKRSLKAIAVRGQVEAYLAGSSLEMVSLELVSEFLCVSNRTLCRRLKREDTSFSQLIDFERKMRCYVLVRD